MELICGEEDLHLRNSVELFFTTLTMRARVRDMYECMGERDMLIYGGEGERDVLMYG